MNREEAWKGCALKEMTDNIRGSPFRDCIEIGDIAMWKRIKTGVILSLSFIGVAAIVVGLGLACLWLFNFDVGTAAKFGDSFGFVNTIVSALAFVAFLVALVMQRQELRLQRQELKDNRKELRRTADAQQKSERMLFLASYLSALESLREMNEHELTSDDKHVVAKAMVQISRVRTTLRLVLDSHDVVLRDIVGNNVIEPESLLARVDSFLGTVRRIKIHHNVFNSTSDRDAALRRLQSELEHGLLDELRDSLSAFSDDEVSKQRKETLVSEGESLLEDVPGADVYFRRVAKFEDSLDEVMYWCAKKVV